jgi:hypothetical protein
MKIGRNDPCHCGSGQKYKRCCCEKDEAARSAELAEQAAARAAAASEAAAVAEASGAPAPAPVKAAPRTLGNGPKPRGGAPVRTSAIRRRAV